MIKITFANCKENVIDITTTQQQTLQTKLHKNVQMELFNKCVKLHEKHAKLHKKMGRSVSPHQKFYVIFTSQRVAN